jgi:glutamate formiminotransferase
VGAVDVAPIVYLEPAQRGAAVAEALVLADRLAHELQLPVFLYGALAGGRTRAELRRGGPEALQRRIESGELAPDAGPRRLHPTAGAVLVAARPPLAAFNLELAAPLETARRIAAAIREGGAEGLPGVRALGLHLPRQGIVQVSTNIEDLTRTTPAEVVRAVQRHATVTGAELIAPAPENAFADFPADIPLRGASLL